MFGIGIIGCGKIAQVRHIPEYNDNPDAKLVAFYDLNAARAKALAEQYGGRAYESVEALLADPNVDAVSVCSANASHAEITVAALEAGKHVLCEKPMATTLAACFRSAMVSVPMPGPTSKMRSASPTSARTMIFFSTSSFTRKFWPRVYLVPMPWASSTARVALGVESGDRRPSPPA